MTSGKTCRGCGGDSLYSFLNLGKMPLAGAFLPDEKAIENERFYPLESHVCRDCSLVQIVDAVDPAILFQDYSFSSSTILALVEHFKSYSGWLHRRFKPETVLEFGCNDGVLLVPLEELGIKAVGIDPSGNISQMARDKGLDVTTAYFSKEVAEELRDRIGQVDVITGSNVFAHNDQPGQILEAARILLKPDGHLCLEVMYGGDLLEQLQWDTLYHEHLTFYSLQTLQTVLERFGFHIVHAERIPMHGGSLRIAASMHPDSPISHGMEGVIAYENDLKLNLVETWISFGKSTQRKIDVLGETLTRLSKMSRVWGYGAAGKATLWVNACKLNFLEAMVDASPLRAGKLMPGTHTPIVFPEKLKEDPPDYVFISAWNYADIISAKESWYRGIWVTPLPELRMF